MGLSFFETMQGEVTTDDGTTHPLRFQVKAESTAIPHYLLTGKVRITGVVDGGPFAEAAALDGEMVISPMRRKEIAYRFRFRDPQGRPCRFVGRKEIRLHRPVYSMTHLEGQIERDGAVVAKGELTFDLDDLPDFVTSWWPSTSIPHKEVPVTLNPREVRILGALGEATIVGYGKVPDFDDETLEEAVRQLEAMPRDIFELYRWGLRGLDLMPLPGVGARFAELSVADRRRWLEGHATVVVQLLMMVLKVAHFGRDDYLRALGHPAPEEIPREKPERHMQRVTACEDLDEETELEVHAVVVGTGAGGAAVAYQLAKQGLAVAIVEEGRYYARHDFGGPPMDRVHAMYRHRNTKITLGTPIVLPQGRAVGGTTTINSGTCFRTPDHVLDDWRRRLGFPEDFQPDSYGEYSDQVAAMLQVEPGTPQALGKIADVIGRGADRLGLSHGPLPRNAPGCPGVGQCILGCPEGAKRSTDVSYIPAALRAGAHLFVGLRATRILMNGDRAVAVEARGSDRLGRPRTLRIRAEKVIIACGSLHTPLMLRENGFRLPWIGRNMSVHPALGVVARADEELEPWNAIPQGYGVHALEEEGIRYEGYYLHPQLLAPTLPWIGDELSHWMNDFTRLAQFGFMVRDEGDGWVRRGPDGRCVVGYQLSPGSIRRLKLGASLLAELLLEAGCDKVFVGFGPNPTITTHDQARALPEVDAGPFDFRLLGAHPLGTCRMARSPEEGVVDFEHRVFGTENLHVVDGSAVPTSLGVNPQMTIMAMALRAGDVIGRGLA